MDDLKLKIKIDKAAVDIQINKYLGELSRKISNLKINITVDSNRLNSLSRQIDEFIKRISKPKSIEIEAALKTDKSQSELQKLGGEIEKIPAKTEATSKDSSSHFEFLNKTFDEFSSSVQDFSKDTIKDFVGGLGGVGANAGVASIAMKGLGASINAAFISTGIGALLSLLSMGFNALINHNQKLKAEQEKLDKQNIQITESWTNQKDEIVKLVDQYNVLEEVTNNGKTFSDSTQQQKYLDTMKQLSELMPNLVQGIDDKGQVHLKSAESIKKELEIAEKLSKLEKEKALLTAKSDFSDLKNDEKKAEKSIRKNESSQSRVKFNTLISMNPDKGETVELKNLQIKAQNLESALNVSTEKIKDKVLELTTAMTSLAGVEVSDKVSSELKKIIEGLDTSKLDKTQINDKVKEYGDLVVQLNKIKELQKQNSPDVLVASQAYDTMAVKIGVSKDEADKLKNAFFELEKAEKVIIPPTVEITNNNHELAESYKKTVDAIEPYNKLLDDMKKGKKLTADEAIDLIAHEESFADAITVENGQIVVNVKAVENLRDTKIKAYKDSLQAKRDEIDGQTVLLQEELRLYGIQIEGIEDIGKAKKELVEKSGKINELLSNPNLPESVKETILTSKKNIDAEIEKVSNIESNKKHLDKLIEIASTGFQHTTQKTEKEDPPPVVDTEDYTIDKYQSDSKDLEGRFKESESLMKRYKDTSAEYRKELQNQYNIQKLQYDLQSKQITLINTESDALKKQLDNKKLTKLEKDKINKKLDDNKQKIVDLKMNEWDYSNAMIETKKQIGVSSDKEKQESFENSKSWIEKEKAANELANKSKIEVLQAQLISEKRVAGRNDLNKEDQAEADKAVMETKKALNDEYFSHYDKLISNKKSLDHLTTLQEINEYKILATYFEEGSENRIKAEQKVHDAEKALNNDYFNDYDKLISDKKSLDQLTNEQEINEYKVLATYFEEGTENRIKAEQKVHDAQKALIEKTKQDFKNQIEDIKSIEDERHNKVIRNLDDEKKKFDDSIDDEIKKMDRQDQADEFKETHDDKIKQSAVLTNQINKLSLSSDLGSKEQSAKLKKDLAQLNDEINKEQIANEHQIIKDGLQDKKEAYDKDIDRNKKAEDDKHDEIRKSLDKILNDTQIWDNLSQNIFAGNVLGIGTSFNTLGTSIDGVLNQIGTGLTNKLTTPLQNALNLAKAGLETSQTNLSSSSGDAKSVPGVPTSKSIVQSKPTPTDPGPSQFTTWQENLSRAAVDDDFAKSEIIRAKGIYAAKKAAGDPASLAAAEAAHQWAEQIRKANPRIKTLIPFDSGGYTGDFEGGQLAILHKKEYVLSADNFKNLLPAISMASEFVNRIKNNSPNLSNLFNNGASSSQVVHNNFNIDQMIRVDKLDNKTDIKAVARNLVNAMETIAGVRITMI